MDFDAQVALLYEVEARPVTGVRGQVKYEEGVSVAKVGACQTVPFVLRHFAGGGKQVRVTPNVKSLGKVRLEGFRGHLSTVHIDGKEVYGVVLGVERVFSIRPVESVVVDATQHDPFRKSAEE